MSEHRRPYLDLLVTMVLFGTAFPSSKFVVEDLPHHVAAMLRFGGAAVVLVLLLCMRRDGVRFSMRDLGIAGAVGLVGVFGYNLFFFWGLSYAPAIDGSVIVPVMSPVITTVVLLLTGREAASASRVAGLVVGVGGAVVFFVGVGDSGTASGSRLTGDLLYLLAAGCWATYSILSKKVLGGIQPLRATTYATGAGAVALALTAVPELSTMDWSGVRAVTWVNVAFLAVLPTAVAYLLYYRALRAVSPVTATLAMFSVPVFGTVSSAVFLHESFTAVQVVGAVVTIVGAVVAVTQAPPSVGRRGLARSAVGGDDHR